MKRIFLVPDGISNKWVERFKILEFTIDADGCLYSPKAWKDEWDNQTKALYLRSIGMSPQNIAKKLHVELTTVKNRWIDNITLNYELRSPVRYDWSDLGFVDDYLKRHINYSGAPDVPDPQLEMDNELAQFIHDYEA